MNTEHRLDTLAAWITDSSPTGYRYCRILDYGPAQGTRTIRLTDTPKGPGRQYAKGTTIIADLDDLITREAHASYQKNRLPDGMRHDFGMYCTCPECTGEEN